MAYVTSNPPALVTQGGIGNQSAAAWNYSTTDAFTAVRVDGYVTNAKALGMKAGDRVNVTKTDATPPITQLMVVASINVNGSGDLTDGTALGGADTD